MMTWNSLLLSKGSIFTCTHFNGTNATAASSSTTTPPRNIQRRRAFADQRVHHPAVQARGPAFGFVPGMSPPPAYCRSSLSAAHGETTKATINENSMAAEAPTGIGRMYGPIRPRTNAMGRIAAITANVARIVGLPTSSTASTATSDKERPSAFRQPEMAHDVLDHHDGVVDQDADGEDQREQCDPVQRVAIQIKNRQASAPA